MEMRASRYCFKLKHEIIPHMPEHICQDEDYIWPIFRVRPPHVIFLSLKHHPPYLAIAQFVTFDHHVENFVVVKIYLHSVILWNPSVCVLQSIRGPDKRSRRSRRTRWSCRRKQRKVTETRRSPLHTPQSFHLSSFLSKQMAANKRPQLFAQ